MSNESQCIMNFCLAIIALSAVVIAGTCVYVVLMS